MPQRKHKPEEIVAKLRQVDVLLSQGRPVAEAIRAIGVTPFTYYRWRKEFGGLKSDQVKRLLNVIDEFTRECLAIRVDPKLKSTDVIDVLSHLFVVRGVPGHVRSDNGPEFVAKAVRKGIAAVKARTAFIEPGNPWENGYCESFNSKLRDELLNGRCSTVSPKPGSSSSSGGSPTIHNACTRASATSRPRRPPCSGREARLLQPWPPSPPSIGFEPSHLMGEVKTIFTGYGINLEQIDVEARKNGKNIIFIII